MPRLTLLVLLLQTTPLFGQPARQQTYPQLFSRSYPKGAALPFEAARPAATYDFVDASRLPANATITSAAKAASGKVWIVTDKGAFQSGGEGYIPLVPPAGPPGAVSAQRPALKVAAVAADRLGQLWAATDKGLIVTDGEVIAQSLQGKDGVPYENMTCLHLTATADLWGGTTEGAWRLRNGQFRYFWGLRWLPGNHVTAIWTDRQGRAWLETDKGMACIEEKQMTLSQKAAHFDAIAQERHDRRGFLSEIHLLEPGNPAKGYRFEISDNDGLWNSIYVGAMAFRFAATKDPAAKKQAKVAMDAMLELERLSGISGYPARAVVTDNELKAGVDGVNRDETVRVPGEKDKIWYRSPVDATVWCKGDTSSDELDGHYFAWYLYHDLVADAAEKAKIAAVVRRTTDHILEHNFTLVGHTGRKTRWGIWTPDLINKERFYLGLRPLNSLEMLTYLTVARHITGDEKYDRAYDDLVQKHHFLINTLAIRRGRIGSWQGINHSDDEMLYMMYYVILRLEKDPARRRILGLSMTRTWEGSPDEQSIRPEHSPLYNFIFGATTGRNCDVELARQTLEDWPWDLVAWGVKNSHRSDVHFKKSDTPGARRQREVETNRVLPASERRLARWNGNPWTADSGGNGGREDDGAAWALAYWIGVYYGYLPGPN